MSTFQTFLDQIPPLLPPRWLQGGNKETLYAKSLQRTAPHYRRELIADSYGEDLAAYDFIDAPQDNAPCVVLLHGLEGSSR
ncbi:alpha/beta hydrolase, partial [Kingella kingae]|nr:alpha/beta hydrolase [Kingella kingae]